MDIKHYTIVPPKRKSPSKDWKQAWYGYFRLEKVTRHELESTIHERALEVDCLLSIVEDVNRRYKKHISLIEVGSGWGEYCMALAGIIEFRLIPHNIKTRFCTAVEAEPSYCHLVEKHFGANKLIFDVIEAAVSDKIGYCRFNKYTNVNSSFGQGMTFGNFGGSKLKTLALAIYHILTSNTITVPTITLDTIIGSHVDIVQCDVQGVEDRVIKGAMNSIKQGKIDYWLIGTHSKRLNEKCRQLLQPWYDCIVDVIPNNEKMLGLRQDGVQLFRRRELE